MLLPTLEAFFVKLATQKNRKNNYEKKWIAKNWEFVHDVLRL
jgi:hypothetical protein